MRRSTKGVGICQSMRTVWQIERVLPWALPMYTPDTVNSRELIHHTSSAPDKLLTSCRQTLPMIVTVRLPVLLTSTYLKSAAHLSY